MTSAPPAPPTAAGRGVGCEGVDGGMAGGGGRFRANQLHLRLLHGWLWLYDALQISNL